MNLKKEFDVVFQPKDKEIYGKRRFLVSINKLHNYVGVLNANKAITDALDCKCDRYTKKLRKFGRIDFYRK